jgi:hypothetical protein
MAGDRFQGGGDWRGYRNVYEIPPVADIELTPLANQYFLVLDRCL